jgi:anaphase-promoting complex subunit 2
LLYSWEPDPVEADPTRTSKSRRTMDIIGMLVGIYGSKELFVNEYRIMLAEKLLSKSDYDIDREIRTLELLKVKSSKFHKFLFCTLTCSSAQHISIHLNDNSRGDPVKYLCMVLVLLMDQLVFERFFYSVAIWRE